MMVIDEAKQLMVRFRSLSTGRKVCVYLFIPNDNRERVDSEDIELNVPGLYCLDQGFMETRIELRRAYSFGPYRDSLRTYRDKERFHVPDPQ